MKDSNMITMIKYPCHIKTAILSAFLPNIETSFEKKQKENNSKQIKQVYMPFALIQLN